MTEGLPSFDRMMADGRARAGGDAGGNEYSDVLSGEKIRQIFDDNTADRKLRRAILLWTDDAANMHRALVGMGRKVVAFASVSLLIFGFLAARMVFAEGEAAFMEYAIGALLLLNLHLCFYAVFRERDLRETAPVYREDSMHLFGGRNLEKYYDMMRCYKQAMVHRVALAGRMLVWIFVVSYAVGFLCALYFVGKWSAVVFFLGWVGVWWVQVVHLSHLRSWEKIAGVPSDDAVAVAREIMISIGFVVFLGGFCLAMWVFGALP